MEQKIIIDGIDKLELAYKLNNIENFTSDISTVSDFKLIDIKNEIEKINGFFNSNFLTEFEKETYLPSYPAIVNKFYDHYKTYSKELIDLFNNNYNNKISNSINGVIKYTKPITTKELIFFSKEENNDIASLYIKTQSSSYNINLIPCNFKGEYFETFNNSNIYESIFDVAAASSVVIKNKQGDILKLKYKIENNKIVITPQSASNEEYFLFYNPYRNAYIYKNTLENIIYINSSNYDDYAIKVR